MKIANLTGIVVAIALAAICISAVAQTGNQGLVAASSASFPAWKDSVQSAPWTGHDLTFYCALGKLTSDLWKLADAPRVVLEGWDQDWAQTLEIRPIGNSLTPQFITHSLVNPMMPTFSIDTQDRTYGSVLDEICTKGLNQIWRFEPRRNIVSIAQKELLTDPRWRLNQPLGSAANFRYTFEQARDILAQAYGLTEGQTIPLCRDREEYEKIKDLVAWKPSTDSSLTARDLLFAMIRVAEANRLPPSPSRKMTAYYYFVRLTPETEPRDGFQGLASRKKLHWIVDMRQAFESAEDMQQWADRLAQERIKQRQLLGPLVDQIAHLSAPGDE